MILCLRGFATINERYLRNSIDKPFSSYNQAQRRRASRQRQRGRLHRRLQSPPKWAFYSGQRNCTGSNCRRWLSPYPRDECRTESSSNIAIYRVKEKVNKIKRRRNQYAHVIANGTLQRKKNMLYCAKLTQQKI